MIEFIIRSQRVPHSALDAVNRELSCFSINLFVIYYDSSDLITNWYECVQLMNRDWQRSVALDFGIQCVRK